MIQKHLKIIWLCIMDLATVIIAHSNWVQFHNFVTKDLILKIYLQSTPGTLWMLVPSTVFF